MKKEDKGCCTIPSLKEVYQAYFPIGAAIEVVNVERYSDLLKKHFNAMTLENSLKWPNIHPGKDDYRFEPADRLVDFAMSHGMRIHGHTLVWYAMGTPEWVYYAEDGAMASRELLLERMQEHIHTVVGRYKGKVAAWDVVNEAIENTDNGRQYHDGEYLQIIGPDYIKKAFQFAHEADPDALLFYNEYQIEFSIKRGKTLRMLKEFREEGIPIHGIGIQSHETLDVPSLGELRDAIETFAALGLKIHISELDLSVYPYRDTTCLYKGLTPELLERQAVRYGELFKVFREYRDVIYGVTFWGAADDHTWLDHGIRRTWPFLFDDDLKPKPAFWSVAQF